MNTLNFSENWNNKLNCNFFTTIRLHNKSKYQVGAQLVVKHKNRVMTHTAEVVQVKEILINQIDDFIAGVDTGYNTEETVKILKTMYKGMNWNTQKLDLVLCKYTKELAFNNAPELFG